MTNRTDSEILKDLIDAVIEYVAAKDDECGFKDENGDPDLYDSGTLDTYQKLSNTTVDALNGMKTLIIEATGDNYFSF